MWQELQFLIRSNLFTGSILLSFCWLLWLLGCLSVLSAHWTLCERVSITLKSRWHTLREKIVYDDSKITAIEANPDAA